VSVSLDSAEDKNVQRKANKRAKQRKRRERQRESKKDLSTMANTSESQKFAEAEP
jgi:hypothetical protein